MSEGLNVLENGPAIIYGELDMLGSHFQENPVDGRHNVLSLPIKSNNMKYMILPKNSPHEDLLRIICTLFMLTFKVKKEELYSRNDRINVFIFFG